MKEEVLKALEFYEIKKSKVELDLGMPKNSLSAMLAGKKEIPKKWVDVLRKYVDDLNNPQRDLETPKEAQIKPEIEKAVENIQNETQGLEMVGKRQSIPPDSSFSVTNPIVYEKTSETVILASFDQLLKRFHDLIESNPKPSDIKLKLEQIKESAKLSNLTPRQTDSITDRVNNFLNGQYNTAKHNLKLS